MIETFSKLQQFVQFLTFPAVRSEASFEVPSFWVRFFLWKQTFGQSTVFPDAGRSYDHQDFVGCVLVRGRRQGTPS